MGTDPCIRGRYCSCRGIAATGDAGATTDAGCRAEGAGGLLPAHGQGVAIGGLAVHQEAAAAADAFAAVVLEAHRPFSGADQLFVELIEGLQQGEVGGDVLQLMALVTSLLMLFLLVLGVLLIQPRLSERCQLLPDRYVLTADEVAELPQGTLPVVLDRRLGQDQNDFRFRLLKLVLERSGTPFALCFSAAVQPQDEAIAALAEGQKAGRRHPLRLLVGVYGAGPEFNRRLRAVPILVTGGILGLRAGWTNQASLAELQTIRSLQDLQRIVLVQGLGWSDVEIFDRAGLRTYTARSEKWLRLVNDNRVQLFPRSVAELEAEDSVVTSLYPQMLLDPHLLIVYPFVGFFYVAPENAELAAAIHTGFVRVIADGSYQRLV